jgi:multicomponent Na+:H+ antiporter subunit G
MDKLRLILAALSLGLGLFFVLSAILGIYRFRFVLNRMHAAALTDTMGVFHILLGLALLSWDMAYFPKLLLILLFLWIGSPLTSHLLARLEIDTDEDAEDHYRKEDRR